MSTKPTYEELAARVAELEHQVGQYQSEELKNPLEIQSILLEAFQYIPLCKTFEAAARKIFDQCKKFTGAQSGYVALLSEDGEENEVLFLDAGGMACDVDPNLPMPIRGLREVAYKTKDVAYDNAFAGSPWMKYMPEGHVRLDNVLFTPLNIEDQTVGIIGIANKPEGFSKRDAYVAKILGNLAAIALIYAKSQESLRKSEEKYRCFVNNLPGIVYQFVLSSGGDFRFEFMGDNCIDFFGYAAEEILKDANLVFELIPRPDAEAVDQAIKKSASTLTPYKIDHRIVKKNGETIWLSVSSIPSKRANGYIIWDGIGLDITDRKLAEESFQNAEKLFRRTFDQSPIGAAIVGIDYKFLKVNRKLCSITGYNAEELLKIGFPDITHPDDLDKDIQCAKDLESGLIEQYQMNKRYIRKNRDSIWIRLSVRLIRDSGGTPLFYLPMMEDIQSQKEKESVIQKKQKELEEHTAKLEQMNTALSVLIEHRGDEKKQHEKKIVDHFKKLIFPYLEMPLENKSCSELSLIINIIKGNIREILFGGNELSETIISYFTPLENQVANLIRENKSTKEIANLLHTSVRAVYFHRENIRKKLNLSKKKNNLKTFLQSRK